MLVRRQAKSLGLSAEVQRKTVHIGAGLYALTLPWLFTDRWPVFMLLGITIVVMLVLRLPKLSSSGIGSTLHSVERRSYGDLLLVLAIGTVFLLSNGKPILYVLPLVIVALSDAAAALTGSLLCLMLLQLLPEARTAANSLKLKTIQKALKDLWRFLSQASAWR